jgi:hypothetical protein
MVSEQIGVVNVGLWHVRSCAATRFDGCRARPSLIERTVLP